MCVCRVSIFGETEADICLRVFCSGTYSLNGICDPLSCRKESCQQSPVWVPSLVFLVTYLLIGGSKGGHEEVVFCFAFPEQ